MDAKKYDFRYREKYLKNQLSQEERTLYEEAMTRKPELVEELKRHIHFSNFLGKSLEEFGKS